jgi:elongation factor 1 alpha-like protein
VGTPARTASGGGAPPSSSSRNHDFDATSAPQSVTAGALRRLLKWYGGGRGGGSGAGGDASPPSSPTLLQALDSLRAPPRPLDRPLRICVSDVYRRDSHGLTAAGRVEGGWVAPHTRVLIVPGGETATVKSVAVNGVVVPYAVVGDNVDLALGGVEEAVLAPGQVLCWPTHPVRAVRRFKAQVHILPGVEMPLVAGQQFTLHSHTVEEPCNVTKLLRTLDREGHTKEIKPRTLVAGSVAVVRVRLTRPVPLETFAEHKRLGRFVLRYSGRTVAAGMILKLQG